MSRDCDNRLRLDYRCVSPHPVTSSNSNNPRPKDGMRVFPPGSKTVTIGHRQALRNQHPLAGARPSEEVFTRPSTQTKTASSSTMPLSAQQTAPANWNFVHEVYSNPVFRDSPSFDESNIDMCRNRIHALEARCDALGGALRELSWYKRNTEIDITSWHRRGLTLDAQAREIRRLQDQLLVRDGKSKELVEELEEDLFETVEAVDAPNETADHEDSFSDVIEAARYSGMVAAANAAAVQLKADLGPYAPAHAMDVAYNKGYHEATSYLTRKILDEQDPQLHLCTTEMDEHHLRQAKIYGETFRAIREAKHNTAHMGTASSLGYIGHPKELFRNMSEETLNGYFGHVRRSALSGSKITGIFNGDQGYVIKNSSFMVSSDRDTWQKGCSNKFEPGTRYNGLCASRNEHSIGGPVGVSSKPDPAPTPAQPTVPAPPAETPVGCNAPGHQNLSIKRSDLAQQESLGTPRRHASPCLLEPRNQSAQWSTPAHLAHQDGDRRRYHDSTRSDYSQHPLRQQDSTVQTMDREGYTAQMSPRRCSVEFSNFNRLVLDNEDDYHTSMAPGGSQSAYVPVNRQAREHERHRQAHGSQRPDGYDYRRR
jgi:hypothetical protein